MARARNVKPGLFKNEILGVQDPILSLLFIGLWTLADKAGRLEDRPLRIKGELFPYRDGLNIDGYLTQLERLGFIHRYKVDDLALIEIDNFVKHQNPHHTEKESELPAYTKHCQDSVKERVFNGSAPADSLIPDSLIPDSLIQEQQATPRKRGSRLPDDWRLPEDWKTWALTEQPSWNDEQVRKVALSFRNYWISKSGKDAAKLNWFATWQNWVMKEPAAKSAKPVEWWSSDSATEAKGRELGLSPRAGEGWPQFRDRIRAKLSERAHA